MLGVFDESQVYRIDHYLGKETVQNLLVFRFGNGIFEPLWNRNYIDHVQITAAEKLGVERRAAFYESAGALRDMIQSHVLQLTSLVAMEAPATFRRQCRAQREDQGAAVHPAVHAGDGWKSVVRGQYGPGIDRRQARARLSAGAGREARLDDGNLRGARSCTWTTGAGAACRFTCGPASGLARPVTEIAIQFKRAPHMVFQGENSETEFAGAEYSAG